MTKALTINALSHSVNGSEVFTGTVAGNLAIRDALSLSYSQGTAAQGVIDQLHLGSHTLAASGSTTINLATGASSGNETTTLYNPDGASPFTIARLKAIECWLKPTNAIGTAIGSLTITLGGGTLGFTGPYGSTEQIRNDQVQGGEYGNACSDSIGWVVGANHNLVVTNNDSANTAAYDLFLAGCSV